MKKDTKKTIHTTLTFQLPISLKNSFKSKVAANGKQIREVLCTFIEGYVLNKKEDDK